MKKQNLPPFLNNSPQKIRKIVIFPLFRVILGCHSSSQKIFFQNPRGKIEVLPLGYGKLKKNCSFGQNSSCPTNFGEKWPKIGQKRTFFRKTGGASWFLTKTAIFFNNPMEGWQNYNLTAGILKICPFGRKIECFW